MDTDFSPMNSCVKSTLGLTSGMTPSAAAVVIHLQAAVPRWVQPRMRTPGLSLRWMEFRYAQGLRDENSWTDVALKSH
ncbi:GntR family transcriptional regulator [Sesbania bispinosa]|nr:GntR family transcriptional regulator [Sesbania bispinosa]